ncbi:tetratricopeptide repeat protein [Micromonospora sp. C51]|uniref:ATP-binding protein n=1 Tax=Micromonospora sp. C51 TaxID=2824879 RepID=UPI001B35E540|nr:tetratricopeptide repeat protein [Micromonospora sp. C51]MBQ1052298.1 tetratricopeptide repeat protein [Micromonospora sp. C51]
MHDTPPEPSEQTRSVLYGAARDVVQARHVSGGVHFHSAPSAGPTPRLLPPGVPDFVNRTDDLQHLTAALAATTDARTPSAIVVIAGTAGVGKTSLALHWAHQVRDQFPHGQLYANLRGYDPGQPARPHDILERFLRALGVPHDDIPADTDTRTDLYRSLLAERRVLIVLDNAATVTDLRPLLPGTGECLTLITSRSRLSALVARDGARRLTLDVLADPDAVTLLQITTDGYRRGDDPQELTELARLCARLPLALRIAAERASRYPQHTLSDLIQDLRDESGLWELLATGDDDETSRVRSVFAWSYQALPADAAGLFRLLGLHPGADFCTNAAAALAAQSPNRTRSILDVLVGAHLIEQQARDRYQFHDLLRAYAADQVQHDEPAESRTRALLRVISWYLHSADNAIAASDYGRRRFELEALPDGVTAASFTTHEDALTWYEAERSNLVAATRAAHTAGLHQHAWQLPALLHHIYNFRHPFHEWFTTTEIGLASARAINDRRAEALLLHSLGKAYTQANRHHEGLEHLRQAIALHEHTADPADEAETLCGAGLACLRLRRLDEALELLHRALTIARHLRDRHQEAFATHLIGWALLELDQPAEALQHSQTAAETMRQLGNRASEIDVLVKQCDILRQLGRLDEARTVAQHTLTVASDTDDPVITAAAYIELGRIHQDLHEPEEALAAYQRATVLQRRLGNRGREATALDATGLAYHQLGRYAEAAEFHLHAATMQRELADPWLQAIAMTHLGDALHAAGRTPEATESWNDAHHLLRPFDDPAARKLRNHISTAMKTS